MTAEMLGETVATILGPDHFLLPHGGRVRIEHRPRETIPWEIFRGHLLDDRQTRRRQTFEAWHVFADVPTGSDQSPLISVLLDAEGECIHVTRGLLSYAWESFEDEHGAIRSREAQRWVRELVGTIRYSRLTSPKLLQNHLHQTVFNAVVGTGRLPITSLESPLPAFTFGELAHFPTRPDGTPSLQEAKLLEFSLRAGPEATSGLVRQWRQRSTSQAEILMLLRVMFNHLALSPYTDFGNRLASFLCRCQENELLDTAAVIDVVAYMLRHLVRHLSAYDLVTFHNFGANYPDALFLDELLKLYDSFITSTPEAFQFGSKDDASIGRRKRLRRRALRQACLIRKACEGLPVPAHPTSPGENLRVLPEPFERIAEEELIQPQRRSRRLFDDDPLERKLGPSTRKVLEESVDDLGDATELKELGMATFLDRPLGIFKANGEVDRTPLLSYEAFSQQLAERRMQEMKGWGWARNTGDSKTRPRPLDVWGVAVSELTGRERPGVVALEDARRAAADFAFLRTTASSLAAFLAAFELKEFADQAAGPFKWLTSGEPVLCIRTPHSLKGEPPSLLTLYDSHGHPRFELGVSSPAAYCEYNGQEYLTNGLTLFRKWETDSAGRHRAIDVRRENIRWPPFFDGEG